MKSILSLLFLFITTAIYAQNYIQSTVDELTKDSQLQNASISILVKELGNNQAIAQCNPLTSIPTASTAKLFSTAIAIEILGENYRPNTRIYHTGHIKDSILYGDIWIIGGGDPSLGSKYFNPEGKEDAFLNQWSDSIKSKGIKEIQGKIIADGSKFGYAGVPDGWVWSDMGNYYGAGPSGIMVFDNMLRFNFKTGNIGAKASLIDYWPKQVDLSFDCGIYAGDVDGDKSYIYGAPYSNNRFSAGFLPPNRNSFVVKGSMPDPELSMAYFLHQYLIKNGVNVKNGYAGVRKDFQSVGANIHDDSYKLLFTHKGRTIKEIAAQTNTKSINLFAESLVCLIGFKNIGKGTTEAGMNELNKYLSQKINTNGLFLNDGSGLSRSNGINATHFCDLLSYMYQSKNYTPFFNSLPVAGVSGTIASLCNNEVGDGRIFAKSGTINKIKSYAGYINSKTGKKYVFAITINNYNCSTSELMVKIEKILNAIAGS